MKNLPCPVSRPSQGFSLIELMTAMVVLAILASFVAQIVGSTQRSTLLSNRMVDAAAQARLAFDRIALDLTMAVRRKDVDFIAANPSAPADVLIFLSAVTSPDSSGENRGISLVSYRLDRHGDNKNRPCLLRAGVPVRWSQTDVIGLMNNLPIRLPVADALKFDVLAPGVVALIVGFQLCPDGKPVVLQNGVALAQSQGQIVYSPPVRAESPAYVDVERIASLVVGLAALDLGTLRLLGEEDVEALSGAFDVPASENVLPVEFWMDQTGSLASLPVTVPLPGRQAIRLFQRAYPMNFVKGHQL